MPSPDRSLPKSPQDFSSQQGGCSPAHWERRLNGQWLRRIGLARFHVDPVEGIVFFGSSDFWIRERAMMSVSLMMGAEFPNIMAHASGFVQYVRNDLQWVHIEPVSNSLRILGSVNAAYARLFETRQDSLPPSWPAEEHVVLLDSGRVYIMRGASNMNALDVLDLKT